MSKLSHVSIDPGILAVPHPACTPEDAYKYVDTLLDWSKLLDEPWVAIYMSERASEVLFADGLFPLREQLKVLFTAHKIVEYDVNTVAKIANQLLAITPSFETYYRLKDVLAEPLETDPDIIRLKTHEGLQSDLARCVMLIAILRKHCLQPLGGHSIILREAPKQVIKVRAKIHEIEHEREDLQALACSPDLFEGDVLVCDDFKGLIECIDETAILTGASDNQGIELSIRIAMFKHGLAQGESPDWGNISLPKIGSDFRETCQRCCADQGGSLPSKILRSVIETIKDDNLPAVHALRTGAGGNTSQRMRGNDKAQRRDIDYEFHLHYWECEDKKIELASLVHHNDFSIPG